MILHTTQQFSIYFGDRAPSLSLSDLQAKMATDALVHAAHAVKAQTVALLQQEHTVQGMVIEQNDTTDYIFTPVGDYLITQQLDRGIGIVTADCMSLVLYDPITHTAGIIHAGWKGLVGNIIQVVLAKMEQTMGVQLANCELYCGPSAGVCCYQVQQDFVQRFVVAFSYLDHTSFFVDKNEKIYFDAQAFVRVLVRTLGMNEEKIYTMYNVCTICNLSYCSYRREQNKACRQITMICLH